MLWFGPAWHSTRLSAASVDSSFGFFDKLRSCSAVLQLTLLYIGHFYCNNQICRFNHGCLTTVTHMSSVTFNSHMVYQWL